MFFRSLLMSGRKKNKAPSECTDGHETVLGLSVGDDFSHVRLGALVNPGCFKPPLSIQNNRKVQNLL